VTRSVVTASLGGALISAPAVELASVADLQAPPAHTQRGAIRRATSSTMFGLAANSQAGAAEPRGPVSTTIVLLGAVFGALIGGIALLWRRTV
jgi:hypothetical protein